MQAPSLANGTKSPTDWQVIDWRSANRQVRNLRQRIFRASKEGNLKKVRSLQKLMLRSYANTVVSVRRVTVDNAGGKTAGVDKEVALTSKAKAALVDKLLESQPWHVKPARRIYIPKQSGAKRPLGIPTIGDRAHQARVKNALEPEWEARFEPSSYGFRPGRSTHDALSMTYSYCRARATKQWILDADIQGAFDNIDHTHLLQAIGQFPAKELIKQWLKAGFMDGTVKHDTPAGTPQGGVISPLLANIAFHGMETTLGIARYANGQTSSKNRYGLVRYADDFIVFCKTREEAEQARTKLRTWFADRGLVFNEAKTQIRHLTGGFDFLGCNFRLYQRRDNPEKVVGLVKPSNASIARFKKKLTEMFVRLRGHNAQVLIHHLNPVLRGWARYFQPVSSAKVFASLDSWLFQKLVKWIRWQHPTKSVGWRVAKYFGQHHHLRKARWVFGDPDGNTYLAKLAWFKITRHRLVFNLAAPDDALQKNYWAKRSRKYSGLSGLHYEVAKQHDFICPVCFGSLNNGEPLHRHHLITDQKNLARHDFAKQRILHLTCHQQVHGSVKDNLPRATRELLL